MGYLRSGYGHLRVIWGPVWEESWRCHSGVILGHSGVILGPHSRKPHEILRISFIWP